MKTIKEFCDQHNACPEGEQWALAHCRDMREFWEKARPEWIIWVATRPGVLTKNELFLFALWSTKQVQHRMTDQRSIKALEVAVLHSQGKATDAELVEACEKASNAAWEATSEAEWASAWAAVNTAARAAAYTELDKDYSAAAWAATSDAAWAAAEEADKETSTKTSKEEIRKTARYAAQVAQAKWLRENTTPNFD